MPGWSPFLPIRRLLLDHVAAASGPLEDRISSALDQVRQLAALDQGYFDSIPQASAMLDGLARKSAAYLAHEYLNRDWQPLYFAEVAELMAEAGLVPVASANFAESQDQWMLSPQGQALVDAVSDPALRQTRRDTLTMSRFRRDLFMKAPQRLDAPQSLPLRAAVTAADLPGGFATPQGTVAFGPAHAQALISGEGDYLVRQALLAVGALVPVVPGDADGAARYNRAVLARAHQPQPLRQLAAWALGSAVDLPWRERLFLQAGRQGDEPVAFATSCLIAAGHEPGDVTGQFQTFTRHRLPFLKQAGLQW